MAIFHLPVLSRRFRSWQWILLPLVMPSAADAEFIAGLDGISPSSTFEHQSVVNLPIYGWSVLEGSARIYDNAQNNGAVIANAPYEPFRVQYIPQPFVPPQPHTRYTLHFDMGFVAGNTGGSAEYSIELGTVTGGVFTPFTEARTGFITHAGNLHSNIISGSDELVFETGDTVSGETLAVRWSLLSYDLSGGNSDFFGFDNVTLDAVSVLPDTTPPSLVFAGALQNQIIALVFDESLEETSATATTNYSFSGGTIVSSAELHGNRKIVVLHVSGLSGTSFTGTFSNVKDAAGNTASGNISGNVLPFLAEDIGFLNVPGQAFATSDNTLHVTAGGVDIWGTEDSMHFVYQERTGDFDVAVKIESFGPTELPANAKALLMVREDTSSGSRHVSVTTYPTQSNWTAYQRQNSYGASSVLPGNWRISWPAGQTFPTWLRVRRSGQALTVYGSMDGEIWTQIGDTVVPEVPYPETVLVGVGVTSMTDDFVELFPAHAVFSHFGDYTLPGGTLSFTEHPQNITVEEYRPATFTAAVKVEGAPAENVIYQWLRNGEPIAGPNSPTYTLSQTTLADSGARFAVIASLPGGATVTSNEAILTVTPDTQAPSLTAASSVGGMSVFIQFDEALDPATATNAFNYQLSPAATVYEAILLPNSSSVLLMVDYLAGPTFTLNVSGVSDLAGNTINASITGEVSPWHAEDVGFVSTPSFAYSLEPGVIEVSTTGADIWRTEDSFYFLYQEITGDFDVRVQLAHITLTNPATRGGLMARENLDAGSRNIFAGTYAMGGQNNWVATVRAEPYATTTLGPGSSFPERSPDFAFPNAWFRLLRAGQTFTTYYSTDGENWVQLGDQITPDTPYPDTIYVGLATASINTSVPTVARYQNYGSTVTPPAARVELEITREGDNLIIAWPAENTEGYVLYSTPDFVIGNWTPVTATPVQVGNKYQVSLPASSGKLFFRLQK